MENDPLKLYNKKTFIKLFESSNDSSDKLYKNTLLDFGDEFAKKNIEETNIESNIKEYTHNSLLNRISMEDYYLFPPKAESLLIMEDGNLKEKQEPEKLNEEETEFLQKINKLNYLTFSPFGESFFPHKFNEKNIKEKNNKDNSNNNLEKNKKEEKMLDILDFDYEHYLLNNDLLFNISMGYIDITKLKKENIVSNDYLINKKEKINQEEKKMRIMAKIKEENPTKSEFKCEVPFKQNLYDRLQNFAYRYRNEEFFMKMISEFNSEMSIITKLEKNSEKNRLLLKWESEFKDKQIKYNFLMQKKERMEKKEIKLQKEKEQELYLEQKKIDEQQKILESELNKLRNKVKKRNSLNSNQRQGIKSIESSSSYTNKYNSVNNTEKNTKHKKKLRTVSSQRNKDGIKSERINKNNNKKNETNFENFFYKV